MVRLWFGLITLCVGISEYHTSYGLFNKNKCFDELGCFNTDDFHDFINRPIVNVPADRGDIYTRFSLYTRKNRPLDKPKPHFLILNDIQSVEESTFNAQNPVKFIVHGFTDTGFLKWINLIANAILDTEDANVIAIDWSQGNGLADKVLSYSQATANTWVVGGEIALFIKFLQKSFGVPPQNCHIIGHSLGSHVAGYAGARLNGTLGRITALDPAGPYFQYMPEHVRLDAGDAIFVDAIHTDAKPTVMLGFGMIQPVGHIDIYPNSGRDQPGCTVKEDVESIIKNGIQDGIRNIISCHHQRAIEYFIESFHSSCKFVAHVCPDYEYYLEGKCRSCGTRGENCVMLGYNVKEYINPTELFNKKFFLTTARTGPYCLFHYVVRVSLKDISEQKDHKVFFTITLHGETAEMGPFKINDKAISVSRGHSYVFMIQNHIPLGEVQRVDIEWKLEKSILDFPSIFHKPTLHIFSIQVEPLDILIERERLDAVSTTCQMQFEPLKPDKLATFYRLDTCQIPNH